MRIQLVCSALLLGLLVIQPAQAGRDAPINNLTDVPLMWMPGSERSLEKVGRAIVSACAQRGWVCQVVAPGDVKGRLNLRSHQADITIQYDLGKFSIVYVSSQNLRYDAEKNTIHRNYNKWVLNLSNDINAAIALM